MIFENQSALDFMLNIPKNSVDLVLTDPPYIISQKSGFKSVGTKGVARFAISTDYGEWDITFKDVSTSAIQLCSLIVLADWIASNNSVYDYPLLYQTTQIPAEYYSLALAEAIKALDNMQMELLPALNDPIFTELWPGYNPRPIQVKLEEERLTPGLTIIEAPMGEGKTEAALLLAEQWGNTMGAGGAYVALPTMATSNQMFTRYNELINRTRSSVLLPRIVHGMAWLVREDLIEGQSIENYNDNNSGEAIDWWNNNKRALVAPCAVGTIDQALRGALNIKHGWLRLFGLSKKCLILDEVHACDAYMRTILSRLLGWCGHMGVPVIILSATLASLQKQELLQAYNPNAILPKENAYPLITHLDFNGNSRAILTNASNTKSIPIKIESAEESDDIASLVVSKVKEGGCACILVNTVKRSQEIYKSLQALKTDIELDMFHARFTAESRKDREQSIINKYGKDGNRPKKSILVATQVVEQSLDVDFDIMFTELAPIDLILQRSGRLGRHKRKSRPIDIALHILPPNRSSYRIYPRVLLEIASELLTAKNVITLPDDFRPLIEACYTTPNLEDKYKEWTKYQSDIEKDSSKADPYLIDKPDVNRFAIAESTNYVFQDEEDANNYMCAKTRLDDYPTYNIIFLEDHSFLSGLKQERPPNKNYISSLLQRSCSIASYYFKALNPSNGYLPLESDMPKWLRGYIILPITQNKWKGSYLKGNIRTPIAFTLDKELGILIEDS